MCIYFENVFRAQIVVFSEIQTLILDDFKPDN